MVEVNRFLAVEISQIIHHLYIDLGSIGRFVLLAPPDSGQRGARQIDQIAVVSPQGEGRAWPKWLVCPGWWLDGLSRSQWHRELRRLQRWLVVELEPTSWSERRCAGCG